MKKFLFLLLHILTLVFAQATVFGKVTEKQSGEPLPGVRIYSREYKVSVSTDFNGQFRLQVPVGAQSIGTNFMGMQSMFSKVNLTEGQEYRLDFALSDELLQEVVVEATQERQQKILQQTNSIETINTKILEDKNTNNVKTALDSKPGINMIDGEPQIRGGSGFTMGVGSRAAIVVDGISLLAGDSGQPQWDFVPLENIDHIDIIKGASSAIYGANAMSGVIAIQTAYPTLIPKTKITAQFGFYDTPQNKNAKWWRGLQSQQGISFLHSRIIDKNFDLVFGGNFFYDMNYLGGPDLKNFIQENTAYYHQLNPIINFEKPTSTGNVLGDYKTNFDPKKLHNQRYRFNFNTRYRFERVKGLSLGLAGNVMFNHTSNVLLWLDGDKNMFRAYPGAMYLQDQTIFNLDPYLKYVTPNGTAHSFNFRYLFTDNKIRDNQNKKQDNDSQVGFGEYQFKRQFPKILNVEMVAGLNFSYTQSNATIYQKTGNGKSKYYMNSASFLQFKKGFHFDRLLLNSIQLDLGGRLEYFNLNADDEDFVPIVRTSMNFELIKGSFLRFAYGTGYRFPSITEKYMRLNMGLFGIFDNPQLKAESSHNLEVGFKQGFKWDDRLFGYFDVAYFFSLYDNTIEYLFGIWGEADPNEITYAGFKFLNTGQSMVNGVEASFYWEANLTKNKEHQLHGMGGYTWLLPQARQPNLAYGKDNLAIDYNHFETSTNNKNNILKYRFLHTLKFDLDYSYQSARNPWANISFGISGRYFSKMENVDKSLKTLEEQTLQTILSPNFTESPIEPDQFYPQFDFTSWFEKYNKGSFIWDARVGYAFGKYGKLSFVINNLTNLQYAIRPMKMEAPRVFSFQYSIGI